MNRPSLNARPIKQTRFGHGNLIAYKYLFFIIGAVLLLVGIALEAQFYQLVMTELLRAGWGKSLNATEANWSMFQACLQLEACRNDAILANLPRSPLPALAGMGLGVVGLMAGYVAANGQKDKFTNKPPGLARWATVLDMKVWSKPGADKVGYVGLTKTGKLLRQMRRERDRCVAVIGGPGSGKTTGMLMPNAILDAKDASSVIVIDIKYPDTGLFDAVGWYYRQRRPVHMFTPYAEHTKCLPLLAGASDPFVARAVAEMIMTPQKAMSGDGDYYRLQAIPVLANLIISILSRGETGLGAVLKLIDKSVGDVNKAIGEIPLEERSPGCGVYLSQKIGDQSKILSGIANRLIMWGNPQIDRATSIPADQSQELQLDQLGLKPGLWYFGITQSEMGNDSGKALLRLVFRQIEQALKKNAAAAGGRLPVATTWYLDEFLNFGHLGDSVGALFNTIRSRGVAIYAVFQSISQGESIYGNEWKEFFGSGFGLKVYFPSYLEGRDRELLSQELGETTGLERLVSRINGNGKSSRTRSDRLVARALLAPEEFDSFSNQEAIIKDRERPPARVILPRLDQPRARGIVNPLHQLYLTMRFPGKLLELGNTLAKVRQSNREPDLGALPADTEPVSSQVPGSPANATSTQTTSQPVNQAASQHQQQHEFNRAINELFTHCIPVTDSDDGLYQLEGAALSVQRGEFVERNWLTLESGSASATITRRGLGVLTPQSLRQLEWLATFGQPAFEAKTLGLTNAEGFWLNADQYPQLAENYGGQSTVQKGELCTFIAFDTSFAAAS